MDAFPFDLALAAPFPISLLLSWPLVFEAAKGVNGWWLSKAGAATSSLSAPEPVLPPTAVDMAADQRGLPLHLRTLQQDLALAGAATGCCCKVASEVEGLGILTGLQVLGRLLWVFALVRRGPNHSSNNSSTGTSLRLFHTVCNSSSDGRSALTAGTSRKLSDASSLGESPCGFSENPALANARLQSFDRTLATTPHTSANARSGNNCPDSLSTMAAW